MKWCPECGEKWDPTYDVCRNCGYDSTVGTQRDESLFDAPAPAHAPWHGDKTEREAGAKVDVAGLRAKVLEWYRGRADGTQDESVAAHPEENPRSIQPRTRDLVKLGLLRKTDRTRPNASGNNCRVYEAVR